MAFSLNRVTLVGNLGKDPEIRVTPQGSRVCNFSIATTEGYKDKASGEWKNTTDWHNVVMWDSLADTAEKYLKKGSKVMLEGKLKTKSYEGKDGVTRYVTEVLGQSMILMGGNDRSEGGGYSGASPSNDNYSQASPVKVAEDDFSDFDDDDVPF
jgi:single-strand DNA-binding protein